MRFKHPELHFNFVKTYINEENRIFICIITEFIYNVYLQTTQEC